MSRRQLADAAFGCAFLFSVTGFVSIAASHAFLALSILALLASRTPWRFPPIAWPLGFFLGWTVVSAAASGDFGAAAPQFKKFYVFLALPVVYTVFWTADRRRRLLEGWFAIGLIAVLVSAAQFVTRWQAAAAQDVDFLTFYAPDRITGFLGHWMTFSQTGLLIFLALMSWLLFSRTAAWGRPFWLLVAGLIGLGLILSYTRSVWLALAACGLYFLWQWRPRALWLAPLAIVALAALAPATVQERLRSIGDTQANAGRLLMWRTGWEMIQDRPLFGVGPERVGPLFDQYRDPSVEELPPAFYGHLHNIYVHYAAERGLPALLALLWLLAKILWDHGRAVRSLPRGPSDRSACLHAGLAAVLGILVVGCFDLSLGDSEILAAWLTLIAVGYAALREPQDEAHAL